MPLRWVRLPCSGIEESGTAEHEPEVWFVWLGSRRSDNFMLASLPLLLVLFPFFLLGQSPFHALRNEFAFNKRVYNLFLGQKSLFQLLSNCFYSVSGQQKKQTTNNFQECPTLLAAPHFENASSCSNSTPMSTFQNIHTVKYSLIAVLMKFWLIKLKPYNL